jgi:hypothetical protein
LYTCGPSTIKEEAEYLNRERNNKDDPTIETPTYNHENQEHYTLTIPRETWDRVLVST